MYIYTYTLMSITRVGGPKGGGLKSNCRCNLFGYVLRPTVAQKPNNDFKALACISNERHSQTFCACIVCYPCMLRSLFVFASFLRVCRLWPFFWVLDVSYDCCCFCFCYEFRCFIWYVAFQDQVNCRGKYWYHCCWRWFVISWVSCMVFSLIGTDGPVWFLLWHSLW